MSLIPFDIAAVFFSEERNFFFVSFSEGYVYIYLCTLLQFELTSNFTLENNVDQDNPHKM